jgi:hypothetical protein
VRVSDDADGRGDVATTFHHYLRVKIFTDQGREKFATVDIPYTSGADVKDVSARTIRPDGSILELKRSDTYRRTLIKTNDLKIQVVSFAVPGIERGVIVEYRWKEVHRNSLAFNLRLRFSRDTPVHDVRYYVRPLSVLLGYSMIARPFHGQFSPPEKQSDGYTVFRLSDVAADADEEYSLPPFEQRPWVFIRMSRAAAASHLRTSGGPSGRPSMRTRSNGRNRTRRSVPSLRRQPPVPPPSRARSRRWCAQHTPASAASTPTRLRQRTSEKPRRRSPPRRPCNVASARQTTSSC